MQDEGRSTIGKSSRSSVLAYPRATLDPRAFPRYKSRNGDPGTHMAKGPTNAAPRSFWEDKPDAVLMAPFLVYLACMGLRDLLPALGLAKETVNQWQWLLTIVRGVVPWLLLPSIWKYLPPLGRPHWPLAILAGVGAAFGWYYGQHLCNWLGLPAGLPPLFPKRQEITNPLETFGPEPWRIWSTIALRVAVATITVPLVEELFWRGFLLRALIDWERWRQLPLGTPSWRANIISSLISTLQHPFNWLVSIFCWLFFNGLMFWKKSLLFMMIVHGVTNLVLYCWAYSRGDWLFW